MRAIGLLGTVILLVPCALAQETVTPAGENGFKLPTSIEEQLNAMDVKDLLRMMANAEASLSPNGRQLIEAESDAVRLLEGAQKTIERYANDEQFKTSVTKTVNFWRNSEAEISKLEEINDDDEFEKQAIALLEASGITVQDFRNFVNYVESTAAIPRLEAVRAQLRKRREGRVPEILQDGVAGASSPLSGVDRLERLVEGLANPDDALQPMPETTSSGEFRELFKRLKSTSF